MESGGKHIGRPLSLTPPPRCVFLLCFLCVIPLCEHLEQAHKNRAFSLTWPASMQISYSCLRSSETLNLQAVFISFVSSRQKGSHGSSRSQRRPWKLGIRIVAYRSHVCFAKKALIGKINATQTFSGQCRSTNLNYQNFDGEGCKLSLYANESCDEHAVYFRG